MKVKQYRKILLLVLMICAAVLFGCVERALGRQLSTQQIASEWSAEDSYAQISCFFSKDAAVTKDYVIQLEQKLKTALQEASEDTSDVNGRTLVDCYSTKGELTLYSDRASITARAFGVGGDFFTFHPLKLLSGSYFDGEDLNKDGVVIDENVAWQLFGSNNVAGMYVEINGVQYPVRGVVKSDKGYFSDAADEEAATVYVSYEILEGRSDSSTGGMDSAAASTPAAGTTGSKGGSYGQSAGTTLDSYELLIKNPVQKFGFNALKEALGLDKSIYEIVENSSRFGLMNRFTVLRNFGIRSMNTKNIVFPYWENRAVFNMYPYYGMLDLMDAKERHGNDCTYFMKVENQKSADYASGIFLYKLADEVVIYLLPISYKSGINITGRIQFGQWVLHESKTFRNNVCRLIYRLKK